jgi:GrpB-like predicted nucleotidyltransferase (UPF0157 family)
VREDLIVMCPYDPEWPASFERERRRIEPILRDYLIRPLEHIGSTSIPGLVAKPIIDMVAVVRCIDETSSIARPLERIGWVHAPEPPDEFERRLSFCYPSAARRTHHLHVVEEDFNGWKEWIAFRDYLRVQPELRTEYADLKTHLAADCGSDPNDRDAYRSGKSEWVTSVTLRALTKRPSS